MNDIEHAVAAFAAEHRNLVTRAIVLAAGGTDDYIAQRVDHGVWRVAHAGVYVLGPAALSWHGEVEAAALAAGHDAAGSHRCGVILWGLDGIKNAPVELSVPWTGRPMPTGVILHRTRRPIETHIRHGIPVTSVERTLLDIGRFLPEANVEMGMESAFRKGLTTPTKTRLYLEQTGARGVPGAAKLRHILDIRHPGRPAGSAGEVKLLRLLRELGIEDPERQLEILLPDGSKATVDFGWPRRMVLLERDSVESRAGARELHYLTRRQNALLELGYELRRYDGIYVDKHPELVARELFALLKRRPPGPPAPPPPPVL
jgi:hypothetical protein